MHRLKDAEHVAAVKWNYPDPDGYDKMREFSDTFNVIDNSGQHARCFKNGGAGIVSAFAPAYPAHDLKVAELLADGKYDEAEAMVDAEDDALGPVRAMISANGGGYRMAKGMMDIVGHPTGPPRLPTEPLNDEESAALRAAMEKLGWV